MDVTAAMLQSQARAGEASMHELVSRLVAELAFVRAELTGMRAEVGRVWDVMTEYRVAMADMSATVEGLREGVGVRRAVDASKGVGGEGWGLQPKRALERVRGRARENEKEGGCAEQNIGRGLDGCINVAGVDSLADASCEAHDGRGFVKAAPERPLEGTVRNRDGEGNRRGASIKEVRRILPVGGASSARCDEHAPRETEEIYPKRDEAREGNMGRDSADCIKASMETGDRGIADMPVKLQKDSGVNKTGFEESTRWGGERDCGREEAGRGKCVKAAHACVSMADKSAEWEDSNMGKLLVPPAQSDADGKEKSQLKTSPGGESPKGTPQLLADDKLRENVEDGKRASEDMAPVLKDESAYETFDDDASTQPPPTVEPVIPLPCPSVQIPLRNHEASRELYSHGRNPGKASYGDNDSVACAQTTDVRAVLPNAMVTEAGVEFKPTSSLNTPESSAVNTSRLKKTRKRRKRRKIGFHELYTEPQEGEEYAAVPVLSGGGSPSADQCPSLSLSPSVPSPAKCGPIAQTGKVVHPGQNEAGSDALITPASTHQCLVTTPVTDAKSSSAPGSKGHVVCLLDRMLSPDATAKPTSKRPQPLPKHRSKYDIGIDGYTSTKSLIASVNALNAEKDRKLECKTKDVVRGRDRWALTAQACHECETFFRSEANSRPEDPGWYARMLQKACRHRFKTLPPATPPGYYDLTFDETETQPPKESKP